MMRPLEEFRESGKFGPAGVKLLYETVAAVARFARFPPPYRYASWESDAVTEVAHDFIGGKKALERLGHLFVLATDERSLELLLQEAVRNFLRSQARRTERGRLIRRLQDVLRDDESFEQIAAGHPGASNWILRSSDHRDPWAGRIEDLVTAAWEVSEVRTLRWRSDAKRRGPFADRPSLVALCSAILKAATGSVSVPVIAEAVAPRLGLGDPPLVVSLDSMDPELRVELSTGAADESAGVRERAAVIWNQLSERERLILPLLDEPVRSAAERLGLGKSATAAAMSRLREALRLTLKEDEEAAQVLGYLVQIAEAWAAGRTSGGGSAS